ncbi:MAG: undecaprenyl-diphosphate phosphatase [Bacillota bacterium]
MLIRSIFLGIIQGLTEFLPVSSSGHLVIFQSLLGFQKARLTIGVFLHFGTLIPVVIIFRKDIYELIKLTKAKRHLLWLIIIGSIPTAFIGVVLEDFFKGLFDSVIITGFMLLITGGLLFIAEKYGSSTRSIKEFRGINAVLVGLVQGLAIIPGISRSGSTIVASLLQGLEREEAARYSFLLSIPVIGGAGLLELKDLLSTGMVGIDALSLIAGTLTAALSGYFAIRYLLHVLHRGSLIIFSYYCFIVGTVIILSAGLF